MEVTLAVLADYSSITKEGKLNILGIFDTIWAKNFPAEHHNMQLVMRFMFPRSEARTKKNIKVRLIDADGNQIFEIGTELIISQEKFPLPVININSDHILNLNNLVFQKQGDYSFHILINEDDRKSVPLKLIQLS
ncbi:MAG: hypothetical protein HYU63_09375 [Armatimonadetes bacterium]|nr:hypothetical protein [Armatimonadota bacterium]